LGKLMPLLAAKSNQDAKRRLTVMIPSFTAC